MEIDKLVNDFRKEYESKNSEFLLFNLANANENANTKVLKFLLEYNNCQFLNSFLTRINLPQRAPNTDVSIEDQEQAIGPNGTTGFIDLYLKYDNNHIIIENKIYGAGDTDKQLARYIATVVRVKSDGFNQWYGGDYQNVVKENVHVVYLTADGSKEPEDNSLPASLKEHINYYPINYNDDILPWLEEDVMPNIPYGDNGMMIAGVLQYIAFLKQLLADESSEVVDTFVSELEGNDVDKYKSLLNAITNNKLSNGSDEDVMKSLRKQLGAHAEAIFSGDVEDVEGGWMLHFTPSFFVLYKKSWAAIDTRKYSIPSIYIKGTPKTLDTFEFNIAVQIDHLDASLCTQYSNLTFTNHNKTVTKSLKLNVTCGDARDKKNRCDYYQSLIEQLNNYICNIDEAVKSIQESELHSPPQNELLKQLAKDLEIEQK